jgi:hypothetical protein
MILACKYELSVLLYIKTLFNPLNAELNFICHLLALLGAHRILHVSRIRVNISLAGKICRQKIRLLSVTESWKPSTNSTISTNCSTCSVIKRTEGIQSKNVTAAQHFSATKNIKFGKSRCEHLPKELIFKVDYFLNLMVTS